MADDEPERGDVKEATSEEVREMLDRIPEIDPADGGTVDLDGSGLPDDLPSIPADVQTVRGDVGPAGRPDSRTVLELLTAVERQPSEDLDRYHVRVGLGTADGGRVVLREVDDELDLLTSEPGADAVGGMDPGDHLDMVIASTHEGLTIATALRRMSQVEWVVVTDVTDAGLDEVLEAVADEPASPGPDQARTDEQFAQLREEVGEPGFDDVDAALRDVTLEPPASTGTGDDEVGVGEVALDELVADDPGESPAGGGGTAEALLAELRSGEVADGTVSELRSALGAAPAGAEAGRDDVGDLRTTVEMLSDAVTAAKDDRRDLDDRLAAVEERVETVAARAEVGAADDGAGIAERLVALESAVEELREEVERQSAWRRSIQRAIDDDPDG